jgi:hypothetical protein
MTDERNAELEQQFDNSYEFQNAKDFDAAIKVITAFTKATTIQNKILSENLEYTKQISKYFTDKDGFIKDINSVLLANKTEIVKDITKNNRIFFLSVSGIITTISVIMGIIFSHGLTK